VSAPDEAQERLTPLRRLAIAAIIVTASALFLALAGAGCVVMFSLGGIAATRDRPPAACQQYGGRFSVWSGWHCAPPPSGRTLN
jgi:hypothetical protein